jgi:hypothetical protein
MLSGRRVCGLLSEKAPSGEGGLADHAGVSVDPVEYQYVLYAAATYSSLLDF